MQAAPWLRARHHGCAFVPGGLRSPGFGAIVLPHDASAVVHTCSSSRRTPEPAGSGSFAATLTTSALNRRSLRWFGIPAYTANPEGHTSITGTARFVPTTSYIATTLLSGHTTIPAL